jgi:hypothetical protein
VRSCDHPRALQASSHHIKAVDEDMRLAALCLDREVVEQQPRADRGRRVYVG